MIVIIIIDVLASAHFAHARSSLSVHLCWRFFRNHRFNIRHFVSHFYLHRFDHAFHPRYLRLFMQPHRLLKRVDEQILLLLSLLLMYRFELMPHRRKHALESLRAVIDAR